jgi:hypothetical protein
MDVVDLNSQYGSKNIYDLEMRSVQKIIYYWYFLIFIR